jgi:hypothetical protein
MKFVNLFCGIFTLLVIGERVFNPMAATNSPAPLKTNAPISLQSTQKLAVPSPVAEQYALQAFLNGVRVGAQLRVRNPDASDEELQHIALRMFEQTQKAKP